MGGITSQNVGALCKAWVNFDGATGTIRASYNVSSVTRNGVGDYTVNFTNAMVDANYTPVVAAPTYSSSISGVYGTVKGGTAVANPATKTTSALSVCYANSGNPATFYDAAEMYVAIFR